MNKKGFTLTELMGVIVILAIVISLGVVAYTEIRNNILERDYQNLVTYLGTKASSYSENTGELNVTVEKLIESGYVEANGENKIVDPRNNNSLNCLLFDSKYENGNYQASVVGTLDEDEHGKCIGYTVKKDIQICVVDGTDCIVDFENWYNKNITLGVLIGGNKANNAAKVTWKTDGDVVSKLEYNTNVSSINKGNYTVEVHYEITNPDGSKKKFEGTDTVAINIDREKPVVTKVEVDKANIWVNHDKKITVSLSDNNGSGVSAVAFFDANSNLTCNSNDLNWVGNPLNTYTTMQGNGNYKICVKDVAGNVSEDLLETVVVSYIDTTAPICNFNVSGTKINESSDWYTNNVTVTIDVSDLNSDVLAYGITKDNEKYYNMKTSLEQTESTTESGQMFYIWVKDKASNEADCYVNVKLDKTNPSCNISLSGTKTISTSNWYTSVATLTLNETKGASNIVGHALTSDNIETYNYNNTIQTKSISTANNDTVYGYVIAESGRKGSCDIKNIYVDTTKPGIGTITKTAKNGDNGEVTISTTISDSGSKLASYAITSSNSTPSNWKTISGSPESYNVSQAISTSGTYYVWAKDQAGNIESKSVAVEVSYIQTTQVRYENTDGTWTSYTTVDTKIVKYGTSYSWSTSQISGFDSNKYEANSVASYTVNGEKTNQISISLKSYNCKISYKLQNADGSYGNATNVVNSTLKYGKTCSWSRSADTTHQAASYSATITANIDQTVNVARKTFTCKISYQLQNANGTYGSVTNAVNSTLRYGQTCSWSRNADTTYQAASYSATITANIDQTVSVNRKTFTCKIGYKLQNADGTYGSYNAGVNKTQRYGETCSWSRSADTTHQAASYSETITANIDQTVNVARKTFTCKIGYKLQNADGTYGSYNAGVNSTLRYGQTCSWSRSADSTYQAASYSATITANIDQTVNVPRNISVTITGVTNGSLKSGEASTKTASPGSSVTFNIVANSGLSPKDAIVTCSSGSGSVNASGVLTVSGMTGNTNCSVEVVSKFSCESGTLTYDSSKGGYICVYYAFMEGCGVWNDTHTNCQEEHYTCSGGSWYGGSYYDSSLTCYLPAEPKPTYTITVNSVSNGSLRSGESRSKTVKATGYAIFNLSANSNYDFNGATVRCGKASGSVNSSGVLTVNNILYDTSCDVTLTLVSYPVNLTVVNGTSGGSTNVTHYAYYGYSTRFTVTPNSGYSSRNTYSCTRGDTYWNSSTELVVSEVYSSINCTVTFQEIQYSCSSGTLQYDQSLGHICVDRRYFCTGQWRNYSGIYCYMPAYEY